MKQAQLDDSFDTFFQPVGPSFSRTSAQRPSPRQSEAESLRVSRALEIARNAEDGVVPADSAAILEQAVTTIWRRVERMPNYILSRDEFSVFNYFQARLQLIDKHAWQTAVDRYWSNQGH